MQEASFIGFVRTILIIVLIYYGLKILARIFLPYILKYFVNKVGSNFEQQFTNQQQSHQQNNTPPKKQEKKKPVVGEYIDYEEID